MKKILDEESGQEIEVYTAAEVQAQVATAEATGAKKKEDELLPKISTLETELGGAKKALGERATEFAQFRKLNEDQLAKLTVAERTIYENGLALEEQRQKNEKLEKERTDAAIDTAIRAKVGTDDKLFAKVKEMWPVVAIAITTPADIERKTLAVLGVIGTTEPDMVASVAGFNGGSYQPPKPKKDGEVAFGETEAGKAGANELGLITEPPKKA